MEEGIEDAWLEGWKLGLAIPERERQDRIGMNRRGLFVQPPVVEGEEVECAAALGVTDVGSVVVKQLGIATEILSAPLSAVAGALTLSAGLAVALGVRPIVPISWPATSSGSPFGTRASSWCKASKDKSSE